MMGCVNSLWFLLVLVLLGSVQGKEHCDYEDVPCMTHAANNVFKSIVTGITDLTEPSDPLYIDSFYGEIPGCTYTLYNPKMTGLKDCHVTKLAYKENQEFYEYDLFCPQLVLQYGYEANGKLGPMKIDGDGNVKLTLNDYIIIVKGQSDSFYSEEDKRLRKVVKNFFVETVPEGRITFEVDNLVPGDKEKSSQAEAYVNEHVMEYEKYVRSAVIEKFMKVFTERLNVVLNTFPFNDLVPKE